MPTKHVVRSMRLAAVLGAGVSTVAAPWAARADNSLGPVVGPFWGQPFPYGYARVAPRDECVAVRRVETPLGLRWRRVWICDHAVTSRY